MISSHDLATNITAASQYNQKRWKDHDALSQELAESNYDLGYTKVGKTPQGFVVDGTLCAGLTCALAVVLARFW